jgi:hypothetical protein
VFKPILQILLSAILILKCNAQKNNTSLKKENNEIEVIQSKWVLNGIEDTYQKDSIPLSDIAGQKVLMFKGDTVKEYFYPFDKASQLYFLDNDSNMIYSKINNKPIKVYEFKIVNDSLVLTKLGRHGIIKEYYSIFKEN